MLQIEESGEFKSGKYGGQSARVQNSAKSCWVGLACGQALNLPKDIFSVRICPIGPGDHMLSEKLLVDISIDRPVLILV